MITLVFDFFLLFSMKRNCIKFTKKSDRLLEDGGRRSKSAPNVSRVIVPDMGHGLAVNCVIIAKIGKNNNNK